VPSFDHEFLVELFRNRPELATELLRIGAGIAVEHARIEHGSIDLSHIVPTEYRADAVVVLRDRENRPITGVVVEVQRDTDRGKLLSWPVYVTTLRAKHACAVLLLVIAPDPKVAGWARQPIEIGHPGFRLRPIVIGFDDVPRIQDLDDARRLPELAVLSAIAHPEFDVANAAVDAIRELPGDRAELYCDEVLSALPEAVRRILEAKMQGHKYKSEYARRYYGEGEAAGIERGRQEGREQGRQALRRAVLAGAWHKLGELTDEELRLIEAINDEGVLGELINGLMIAETREQARAALERARRLP
jgi:hypothetical protein